MASIKMLWAMRFLAKGFPIHKAKADAIRDWVMPTTGKQSHSFSGLWQFVRQHIRHMGDLTAPLDAVKNQKSIPWQLQLAKPLVRK
jgi:hypothetical protein